MVLKELTPDESWEIFNKLPDSIQDIIDSKESADMNVELSDKFNLSGDQFDKMINLFFLIYGRILALSDIELALKNKLELNDKQAKDLTLAIAQKKFWPMREYLGGVEKLIVSLGGEIPKETPKPPSEQKEVEVRNAKASLQKNSAKKDNVIEKTIKTALEENKTIEDQLLTSRDITLTNSGEIKKPSIKYWFSEYIQTLGAGYHSNLDRIGFLYNNPNAKRLSDEERLVLGAVLKSYDDGDSLPFSETTGRLLVEKMKERNAYQG